MDTKLFSPSQPVLSRPPHTLFLVDNLLLACLAEPRVQAACRGALVPALGTPGLGLQGALGVLGQQLGLLCCYLRAAEDTRPVLCLLTQSRKVPELLFYFFFCLHGHMGADGSWQRFCELCLLFCVCVFFFFPLGCVTKLLQAWNRQMGQGRGASALPPAVTSSC